MKLLRVDASPKGAKSNSRMLADEFVETIGKGFPTLEIDHLDLAETPPAHVTAEFVKATYTPEDERTSEMKETLKPSDELCRHLLAADALLFSMPMYNWSMPSSVKAYIDAIVRTGLTYGFTAEGGTEGYLTQDKVLVITSRGVNHAPGSPFHGMDALTLALRSNFSFLGIDNPDIVNAEPMQFASPEDREKGLTKARAELRAVAEKWVQAG